MRIAYSLSRPSEAIHAVDEQVGRLQHLDRAFVQLGVADVAFRRRRRDENRRTRMPHQRDEPGGGGEETDRQGERQTDRQTEKDTC